MKLSALDLPCDWTNEHERSLDVRKYYVLNYMYKGINNNNDNNNNNDYY